MDKQEFRDLFYRCLEEAALNLELNYQVKIPRQFEIEFHGLGFSKGIMDAGLACDFCIWTMMNLYASLILR